MALTTPKMRPLALLGGMTYHATALYYTLINSHIQTRLGGSHSARLLMHSFDHAEMSTYLTTNQWPLLTRSLVQAAQNMKAGGAQAIALCVNTAHKVADELERDGGLQLLHIIDFTAEAVCAKKLIKIALLGTKPVMEEDFMISRLEMKHGLEVVVPGKEHRERMHEVIFGDLGTEGGDGRDEEVVFGCSTGG